MTPDSYATATFPEPGRVLRAAVAASLVLGLVYRLAPLAMGPEFLARFFITEDGYLMLTVARNLAIGNGLSVSAGEIATNGVQPLGTFLYTIPYLATGGAKLASLAGIVLIMTAISVAAAWTIRAFAARVLADEPMAGPWAWLVAALWFVGPITLFHSMNALETGLSTLAVVGLLLWFGHLSGLERRFTTGEKLALGALAGIAFLARIDCAFLVTAIFAVHLVRRLRQGPGGFGAAVGDLFVPGVLSLVFAAPWLVYNKLQFGSIMPISGTAQSLSASFGQNLGMLPVKLFELTFPMLPLPRALEGSAAAAVLGLVTLGVLAAFAVLAWRRRRPFHAAVLAYALYGLALAFYYGALFGAPHFLSRYLAPISPLLIVAALAVALRLARSLSRHGATVVGGLGAASLVLCLGLLGLKMGRGPEHEHFQVVGWVEANVPEETWVGAVQTGTLGYWHDRTINLDGKVNPDALEARRTQGDVLDYVVDSPIDYLADWPGITGWVDRGNARFADTFEVIVDDPALNLGVLRRRGIGTSGG